MGQWEGSGRARANCNVLLHTLSWVNGKGRAGPGRSAAFSWGRSGREYHLTILSVGPARDERLANVMGRIRPGRIETTFYIYYGPVQAGPHRH